MNRSSQTCFQLCVGARAILFLCIFAAAGSASAQTQWTAGTGDWFDNNNWSLDVPNSASGDSFDAIIANGGTAQLQAPGGSVRRFRVGLVAGTGNLLIDAGTLNVTDDLHVNEGSAGPSSVIIQNGSTVTAVDTVVGFNSAANTSFLISGAGTVYNATNDFNVGRLGAGAASLTVDAGAVLTSVTSSIAPFGGAAGSNATVTGAGSRWSSSGAFTVGSGANGSLTIEDQGTVHVGTTLSIASFSQVHLNGGTLRFNTVGGSAGLNQLFYTAGTIQLGGNRDFANDTTLFGLFPGLTIPSGKKLVIEGNSAIQIATLTVDGGNFDSQGTLSVGSTFAGYLKVLNAGKVVAAGNASIGSSTTGINLVSGAGSTWTIGGNLTIGNGDLKIQNQGVVHVGGAVNFTSGVPSHEINLNGGTLRFSAYSDTSRLTYTAGTIQLSGDRSIGTDAIIANIYGNQPIIPTGKQLTVEGTATIPALSQLMLSGGTLSAGTVLMSPGSRIVSTQSSQVTGAMLALAGSVIDATGANLTLGDATKVNGFYGNGAVDVGPNTVTLADANDAVLDSAALVTLGAGGSSGALAAANGLTLDFGGNIAGFGTVDTPNNAATPFINNGHVAGSSALEPITLTGYVKGVGTLDNVLITGTDAPGFSPATVVRGSVVYGGVLEVEIGGATAGSFDQINHVLGAGVAELGGALDVKLINGFSPILGDLFEIITASGGVNGSFATEVLPTLTAGLDWNVLYGANSVVLEVAAAGLLGDYNQNGIVDAADYTVWRDTLGSTTNLAANGNGNTVIDAADLTVWQANFGRALGSGAHETSAVPEPSAGVLLFGLAAIGILVRRCPGRCKTSVEPTEDCLAAAGNDPPVWHKNGVNSHSMPCAGGLMP